MNMFGGFGSSFWKDYHTLVPQTEPADEYDDRVALYESYHHLNHWAIFGGGYRSGAMSLLRRLLKRYGTKS
jgi:fructosamine-3-kinase